MELAEFKKLRKATEYLAIIKKDLIGIDYSYRSIQTLLHRLEKCGDNEPDRATFILLEKYFL